MGGGEYKFDGYNVFFGEGEGVTETVKLNDFLGSISVRV